MLMCLVIMKFGYINTLPPPDFYKPGTEVEKSEKEALSAKQNEIIVFEAKKKMYETDFGPLLNFFLSIFESMGLSNYFDKLVDNSHCTSEIRELTSSLKSCQEDKHLVIENNILTENLKTGQKEVATEIERLAKKWQLNSELNSDLENLLRMAQNVETKEKESDIDQIRKIAANSAFIEDIEEICEDSGCKYIMKYVKKIQSKATAGTTYPFDVYLSKIRDPSIRYARDSVNEKIASLNRNRKMIFYPNFIGMVLALKRVKNQERIIEETKKTTELDEFNSKSLGNDVQFFAQVLYGYGYWGRYSVIEQYLQYGKVTCNYEEVDLLIEEYKNIFIKECDKLDFNMAEYLATKLNIKIKKNLSCLLAHSHGSEQVNDLVSNIDIFTRLLSENCGAITITVSSMTMEESVAWMTRDPKGKYILESF